MIVTEDLQLKVIQVLSKHICYNTTMQAGDGVIAAPRVPDAVLTGTVLRLVWYVFLTFEWRLAYWVILPQCSGICSTPPDGLIIRNISQNIHLQSALWDFRVKKKNIDNSVKLVFGTRPKCSDMCVYLQVILSVLLAGVKEISLCSQGVPHLIINI